METKADTTNMISRGVFSIPDGSKINPYGLKGKRYVFPDVKTPLNLNTKAKIVHKTAYFSF